MIQLQSCDLVLVHGTNLINEAIQEITNSSFSHVAGMVNYTSTICEAQGWQLTSYSNLYKYKGNATIYRLKQQLTPEQKIKILDYISKQIGSRYDYLLIGLELLRYTLNFVTPYVERKRHICSTLWADAYKQAGIILCEHTNIPSPADIANSPLLEVVGTF